MLEDLEYTAIREFCQNLLQKRAKRGEETTSARQVRTQSELGEGCERTVFEDLEYTALRAMRKQVSNTEEENRRNGDKPKHPRS